MGKTKTAFVGETLEEPKKKRKEEPKKVHISGLKGGQRIKVVEADLPTEVSTKAGPSVAEAMEGKGKKVKALRLRSKKYQEAKTKIKVGEHYPLPEAIKLVKETSYSKFDGSIELHLVVKKTGTTAKVTFPHLAGKEKKIEIASDETIKKLTAGKIDFDVLLATAEMMPKLVPFARILGPKGLMPNPKNGTLLTDIKKAKSFSAGTLNLKTEKEAPLIHTVVGKVSQNDKELIENTEAILNALGGSKQILKGYMKATMGPSVKLDLSS
ncbi:50S ribosomal protein L1 [Candidatus Woesebacteria bacterium]|nr:50S ribosomal protein L1 [Candidatus Woesebacteria bacterium]